MRKPIEILIFGLFSLSALFFVINGDEGIDKRLGVKIYYEALCPDSMFFIRQQLYPFLMDKNMLQFTDLKFIPYGKVSSWRNAETNVTTLYCQHGNQECELNAMHACMVEHNSIVDQLKMIHCLMRGYATNSKTCSKDLDIDISEAKRCKNTRTLLDILHKYGKETDALEISFIPAITLNDIFEPFVQQAIFYNFPRAFCKAYNKTFNITLNNCANSLI